MSERNAAVAPVSSSGLSRITARRFDRFGSAAATAAGRSRSTPESWIVCHHRFDGVRSGDSLGTAQ